MFLPATAPAPGLECKRSRAPKRRIRVALQAEELCPDARTKIFLFPKMRNHAHLASVPPRQEGRIAIVTKRETGCDGREDVAKTNNIDADGKAVWSWRPDAGADSATMLSHRADDGDKKARSHRGDHGISRKPSRREGRIVWANL
jgi:hypothetical protein